MMWKTSFGDSLRSKNRDRHEKTNYTVN
jgi:hypothetical protein